MGLEDLLPGGPLKGWQGGDGYWWGTSAPLHADSSAQWLDLPLGSWLPTERVIPETNVDASAALNGLAPEVTPCPFCSTAPPTETSPGSVSERTPQGPEQREARLTEPSWGLPTTVTIVLNGQVQWPFSYPNFL